MLPLDAATLVAALPNLGRVDLEQLVKDVEQTIEGRRAKSPPAASCPSRFLKVWESGRGRALGRQASSRHERAYSC